MNLSAKRVAGGLKDLIVMRRAIILAACLATPALAGQLTPSAIKTELDANVGVNKLLRGNILNGLMTDMNDSYGAKLVANIWAAPQTFSSMPILAAATGCYVRANGAAQVGCDTVIPAAAGGAGTVSGVLQGDGAGNVSAALTAGTGALLRVNNSYFPGLTDNNSGTGYPGMYLPSTSSWFINQDVTTVPTTNTATLRIQRQATYTGGLASSGIFNGLSTVCTIGAAVTANEWCGLFVMHDSSSAGTPGGADGQLALNVSYFKDSINSGGWAMNIAAVDDATPNGGDVGTHGMATIELDVFGNGTDSHNRRTGYWVVNGLRGAGTAMEAAYAITVNSNNAGATWKNGLYLGQWFDDAAGVPLGPTSNFVNVINMSRATVSGYQILGVNWSVNAHGSAVFNTTDGSWSSHNVLKNVLIGTQTSVANPSIGIGDSNTTNFFALANAGGTFEILSMPGVNDSTTSPIVAMQIAHSTGGVALRGPTGGGAPAAGMIGEEIESAIPVGSAVAMTSATPANITSVNLTAGNWLCYGSISSAPAAGTTTSAMFGTISDTSATFPTQPNDGAWVSDPLATPAGASVTHPVGQRIYRTASPITVYLVGEFNFAGGTMGGYGYLGCLRQP